MIPILLNISEEKEKTMPLKVYYYNSLNGTGLIPFLFSSFLLYEGEYSYVDLNQKHATKIRILDRLSKRQYKKLAREIEKLGILTDVKDPKISEIILDFFMDLPFKLIKQEHTLSRIYTIENMIL